MRPLFPMGHTFDTPSLSGVERIGSESKRSRRSKCASRTPSSTMRLLLIEDNFDFVESLTELLAKNRTTRFVVRATNTLHQGLRAASRGDFDAVLLDLSLPDSAGGETFRKVRANVPDLPVIILSGNGDEDLAFQLVHEGAQDYFIKGEGDLHLLPRAIRYAIERHRIEQALQAERNLLRNVINSLRDMVYVRDLEGCYVVTNLAHARYLGAGQPGDVVGRTPFDFLPAAHARMLDEDDRRVMETRIPVVDRIESVPASGDHGVRWFSTSKVPLFDATGEVIGVVGCFHDITEQKQAEEALHASDRQLRALAGKLQTVREEDRTRIARELHDCLGQHLAVLRMSLGGLFAEKPAPRVIQRKLSSMGELIDAAIATVRGICADLRPPMLDELGLSAAIEWQAQQFEKRSGLNCRFVADDEIRADTPRSTALYRIAQESLTNVFRHAKANNIEIELRRLDGHLRLRIRDDGWGIRPEEITQQTSLGLRGMRERVETFGGNFEVCGTRGKGTIVTATIPL